MAACRPCRRQDGVGGSRPAFRALAYPRLTPLAIARVSVRQRGSDPSSGLQSKRSGTIDSAPAPPRVACPARPGNSRTRRWPPTTSNDFLSPRTPPWAWTCGSAIRRLPQLAARSGSRSACRPGKPSRARTPASTWLWYWIAKVFRQEVAGPVEKVAADVAVSVRPAPGAILEEVTGFDGLPPASGAQVQLSDMGTGDSPVLLVRLQASPGPAGTRPLAYQ